MLAIGGDIACERKRPRACGNAQVVNRAEDHLTGGRADQCDRIEQQGRRARATGDGCAGKVQGRVGAGRQCAAGSRNRDGTSVKLLTSCHTIAQQCATVVEHQGIRRPGKRIVVAQTQNSGAVNRDRVRAQRRSRAIEQKLALVDGD